MSDTATTVVVHRGRQALADTAAARLVVAIVDAQSARGVAHVSMTGGSMGSQIIESVCAVPARDAVNWAQVHVWWGDERWLPDGHADRNDTQNDAAGLDSRVLGPDRSASAEESAQAYSDALHAAGADLFDVMVLGVGPDGHVASLFPNHPVATVLGSPAVAVHDSPKPPATRVSLTRECLERSREVWFLVSGADKADAVRRGVTGAPIETTPAAHLHGVDRTLWLVDTDAAADLEG